MPRPPPDPLTDLPAADRDLYELRRSLYGAEARRALNALYGKRGDAQDWIDRIDRIAAKGFADRPAALKQLDMARVHEADWFQRPRMLGYSAYVDRFAGDLKSLAARLDYLAELGVSYLHLLPIARPRAGANDGGYAVADYEAVNPALGTVEDLRALAAACRGRGISLVSDLVLNHCADSHRWAQAAREGDPAYQAYFYTYDGRRIPERYEAHLPEVFPVAAPGNFTWVPEMRRWVWTTFYGYQWDLNYTNPAVFAEMLAVMLKLANRGIEALRLDSVAFLWKRMGTACRNEPEAHEILRAYRAFLRMAAPALALKAEAIVGPEHLAAYLGEGAFAGRECHLAYQNTLMALLWSTLAEGRVERLVQTLARMPPPPSDTAWITYVRCHDDIGWTVLDAQNAYEGTGAHTRFLTDFYAGRIAGSFARGADFQTDEGRAVHGSSGTLAALAGLAAARDIGDKAAEALAVKRILLLHGVLFVHGGIPLLFMGDEIGLGNDPSYADDPEKAADSRWLHRPVMDWEAAARRHRQGTAEAAIFEGLQRLASRRASTPALHADAAARPARCDNPHVFALLRESARGRLLLLANFSDARQRVPRSAVEGLGFKGDLRDRLEGRMYEGAHKTIQLDPYESLWLEPAS